MSPVRCSGARTAEIYWDPGEVEIPRLHYHRTAYGMEECRDPIEVQGLDGRWRRVRKARAVVEVITAPPTAASAAPAVSTTTSKGKGKKAARGA